MFIELTPEQRQLQAELRQYFSNLISAEEYREMEAENSDLRRENARLNKEVAALSEKMASILQNVAKLSNKKVEPPSRRGK